MERIRFGKTELHVSRTGFGAIPIQRISDDEAVKLLQRAFEAGVTLFDTARAYTDSEHKIGLAFEGKRKDIVLCTKTLATTRDAILKDFETSLNELKTDYIDVYHLHNPGIVALPGDEAYDTVSELRRQGAVRHIGFTNHDLKLAAKATESGQYDVLQFPLSPLSTPEEFALSALCEKHDVGLLAMKALAGGILTNAATSFVTLRAYANIVPIWGIQFQGELDEIIGFENHPPAMTEELRAVIERDREELCGAFCRGCGYCLPCPAEIPIPMAAKISYAIFRMRKGNFFTPEWRENMDRIRNCTHCNHCKEHCPYGLDTPALLASELEKYDALYERNRKGLPLEMPGARHLDGQNLS
jgi:aryl-alcohol dehydrogenase-like predicted oxidoreductase